MLRSLYIGFCVALFFSLPIAHAEPSANKCTDGKHITYANMPCEKLGLQSIGPVKDTVIVVPAIQQPKQNSPEDSIKGPSGNDVSANDDISEAEVAKAGNPKAEKTKPLNSLIEQLMH